MEREGVHNRNGDFQLLHNRLEGRFFQHFLPLVYSKRHVEKLEHKYPDTLRVWKGSNGKAVVFLPPPPKIKDVPHAKPERLGRVIKQLATCYRLDLRKKIACANKVLATLFKATEQVAVAFSGGRDSLVAMHLARQIKPDIPIVMVNTGIEFPESLTYVRQLRETLNLNLYEAKADVSFWDLTREGGLPVAGRGNTTFMKELSVQSGVKLSNSCCRRMKETPARQFYREHKIEGVVTGLRVQESRMRKMNFADYGALRYSSTYDTLICWPLYAWTSDDIENYTQIHNLQVNPLYEAGYQRVGCWACLQDMFYKDSHLFTLQQEHPGLYKTILAKFGDQMTSLLKAWAGLDDDIQTEHFNGLYRPCFFDELEEKHKQIGHQSSPVLI